MQGVWTALVTPLNEKNEIDFSAFRKILEQQVDAKVTGVVPCGTTGESATLTLDEKKELIKKTVQELKGSGVLVFAGTGTNNTQESIEFSKWASSNGADGVMIVTPYYNKPSQAGLENHFLTIADSLTCEVIAYNVPSRTGTHLSTDVIARLAMHPRIRTLKEATGNVAFTSEILDVLKTKKLSMDILAGDDATFLPLLSVGAEGVISVASNLFPHEMVAIQTAAKVGNFQEAKKLHQHFYPLFRDLFIESNPVPIKYAMKYIGLCHERVRSPLASLTEAHQAKLVSSLIQCGIRKGHFL